MRLFFFIVCLFGASAFANIRDNTFGAGIEVSHMRRARAGGTEQNGRMEGYRLSYDLIKPSSIYVGVDHFHGQAPMRGYSGTGRPLYSIITDNITELRLGYTLQANARREAFFSPFTGYGFFKEQNDFLHPSTLTLTFTDRFNYIDAGFLSGINISRLVSLGVNFKLMFMLDGTSLISNDPQEEDLSLQMTNEINSRIELPIMASSGSRPIQLLVAAVPFAEFRHFGGKEGFPYDFIDTKFSLIGGRISIICCF
jgi:hypothetical protein